MKAAFFCTVLLLAGAVSCETAQDKSISLPEWLSNINLPQITLPENLPEWIADLIDRLPDSVNEILDKLPEIIAAIPDIVNKIPEIIEHIIEKIPEVIPIILDKLPEIIAQVPAVLDRIKEIVGQIIDKLPELIPIILEKIPEIIAQIPELVDKIKEKLEELDWFPTLPDLDKPDWWPITIPELPEYNKAVAGTPSSVAEFPGIVQIEVGTGPVWAQGCVGSILTSLHVLSAASCFSGDKYNPRFRRVRAGSSTRHEGGSVVEVDRAVNHPSFGQGNFNSDISVVRLRQALILSVTIQQTPIISANFELPTGVVVVSAGWDSTAQGGLISDRGLYKIDLVKIDNADCAARWNKIPGSLFEITSEMICVARPETGGRNGGIRDMGAPVYYDNVLSGIVSLGAPVGNQYLPVVATNVASYTNWIVENAV